MAITGDTELLTINGWKRVDRIKSNEKIAKYNIYERDITFDPIRLDRIHSDYIYLFNSSRANISFNVTKDTNILYYEKKNGDIITKLAYDTYLSSNNFIPISGSMIGNIGINNIDKLNILLYNKTYNIEYNKDNTLYYLNDLGPRYSKDITLLSNKLGYKLLRPSSLKRVLIIPNNDNDIIYNSIGLNIDYSKMDDIMASEYIEYYCFTKNSILEKKYKEKGLYLYTKTNKDTDVKMIQALGVLCNKGTKVIYDNGEYHIYIRIMDATKCYTMNKEVIYYNDYVYKIRDGFYPIRHGYNVCIIGS